MPCFSCQSDPPARAPSAGRCTGAVNLAVAAVVYQPEIRKIVRASVFFGNHSR
jgi:hypothetical protein